MVRSGEGFSGATIKGVGQNIDKTKVRVEAAEGGGDGWGVEGVMGAVNADNCTSTTIK